jgi:hypothetical protein
MLVLGLESEHRIQDEGQALVHIDVKEASPVCVQHPGHHQFACMLILGLAAEVLP